MKQAVIIQTVACCSGLAGLYLTDNPQYKWILAALIILSAVAAMLVAWSERQEKAFVQRALESLIASVKPNDLARKRVFSAIYTEATNQKMPITQTIGFSIGLTKVKFFTEHNAEMGVLLIDEENVARMSVLTDQELKDSAKLFFKGKSPNSVMPYNDLAERISEGVRVTLWEQKIETPKWCLWSDDNGISAPTSPPDETCIEEKRVCFTKEEIVNMQKSSLFALDTLVQQRSKIKLEN